MLSLDAILPRTQRLPLPAAGPAVGGLSVRGLVFEADGKRPVDHIDLDLNGSGVTAILGPNGAGKSLFLRLIHGLLKPSSGEILWGNEPISPELRKRHAMVFQKPVLLRRSVAANLDFVLPRQPEKRDYWLTRTGLDAQAGQPARRLSGGEQQRLAMARALANGPDVLLLDEPTASLDPASASMIEALVQEAAQAGTKVLLVTHSPSQARRLARDVVFIARGRVAEMCDAQVFFDGPTTEVAKAYLAGELVS